MDSGAHENFIDIDGVIRKKSPHLYKFMPRFLLRYLKRITHQEEMNRNIRDHRDDQGVAFVEGVLTDMGISYESFGKENIPSQGRFIFASNHPLGGLDGLVLMNETGKLFPGIKFIVNDLLLNVKNLEGLFVPVNKHGKQSVEYVRRIDEAYSSDNQILYFPAGLCSRKLNGKITDLPWQKNFISKSIKYKRDIIPVYFDGQNSSFFYNLSNWRKRMGINLNLEMLYLVDEMYNQKNKSLSLHFGKPIPYTTFDSSKSLPEWTNFVRETVYSLKL